MNYELVPTTLKVQSKYQHDSTNFERSIGPQNTRAVPDAGYEL
jgi:hypothetical protein